MRPSPRTHRSPEPDVDRLSLKPPLSANGYVDGGWWPRSLDLSAEVPDLATALADRIGPVWRVAFAPSGWAMTARSMIFEGRLVRLEGIIAQHPNVVHVTGGTMRRVTLLVVPPQATTAAATQALAEAAGQNNETAPETILRESGATPGPWLPAPRGGDVGRRHPGNGTTRPPLSH